MNIRSTGIIFILLTCICHISFSQANLYHPYIFPDTVPERYKYDSDAEYERLSKIKVTDLGSDDMRIYADLVAFRKQQLFFSGNVYIGWTELEDYLNAILQKVTPDSLKDFKGLHVYVARSTEKNAFSHYDGTIVFNIGLLAQIKDEAAIAEVLGHEVAHYIYRDNWTKFRKWVKIIHSRKQDRLFEMLLNSSHGSRTIEQAADNTGYLLCLQAGYNLHSALNTFEQSKHENDWAKSQYSWNSLKWQIYVDDDMKKAGIDADSLDFLFLSHPEPESRADVLRAFIDSNHVEGKPFIVSQSLFEKFSSLAKKETVHLAFAAADYETCIEKSFSYYLRDDDPSWLYYLNESTRRLMYRNPATRRQGFLTNNSKKKIFDGRKGIMHDINYLIGDSVAMKEVRKKDIMHLETIPFETYDEAFRYFSRLALDAGVPETKLSIALYYHWKAKTDSFNIYIDQYMADPNSLKKDYSESLKSGNIIAGISENKNEIMFFQGFYSYRTLTLSNHYLSSYLSRKNYANYYNALTELSQFAAQNKCIMIDLCKSLNPTFTKTMNYRDINRIVSSFKTYREIDDELNPVNIRLGKEFWKQKMLSDPDDTDALKNHKELFIYAPELWDFFKQNNIRSVRSFVFYSRSLDTKLWLMYDYTNAATGQSYYSNFDHNGYGHGFINSLLGKMRSSEKKAFSAEE